MKIQENIFFIDKVIAKYHSLTSKEKSYLNLCLAVILVLFIIGSFYNTGEIVGNFWYNITH